MKSGGANSNATFTRNLISICEKKNDNLYLISTLKCNDYDIFLNSLTILAPSNKSTHKKIAPCSEIHSLKYEKKKNIFAHVLSSINGLLGIITIFSINK